MRIPKLAEKKLNKLDFFECQGCDYMKVCTKSCIAEVKNGEIVDEKICTIEKACIDAIAMFAEKHQCNRIWRDKILKHYLSGSIHSSYTKKNQSS